ncbi:hypothetical protein FHV99_002728 [Ochrobactrum sp. P20RRXII]|nr:hypothetical protein [Ochrobactrum sp. P20RRXII]
MDDLPMRNMPVQQPKNGRNRTVWIVQEIVGKGFLHTLHEISFLALPHGRFERLPALEIDTADKDGELGRKINHLFLWKPVAQRLQNASQQTIGSAFIPIQLIGKLLNPLLCLLCSLREIND